MLDNIKGIKILREDTIRERKKLSHRKCGKEMTNQITHQKALL